MNRVERGARSYQAGLAAEDIVAKLYQSRGGAILARRWRCPVGEIDLIVRLAECIVFAEVKHRKNLVDQDPVSPKQWRHLEAAAETYILRAETGQIPLRFDLVIVDRTGAATIYENARETE